MRIMRSWTEAEIHYIVNNRGSMTDAEIAAALGRTKKSVKQAMGFRKIWRTPAETRRIMSLCWMGERNPRWKNGISKLPEYQAIKRERYEYEIKARSVVSNAIQAGKLEKQPCEVCGNTVAEAHHDDYDQPLMVRWLCRQHHIEVHKELNRKEKESCLF